MIKINEIKASKSMLENLTEKEASIITGGALINSPTSNNNLLSDAAGTQLAELATALQNALSKLAAQIAANSKNK